MAAGSFRGVEATQNFRWGYTCEHCKRPVEKRAAISVRNGSMQNAATWTYTTPAGAEEMKRQALVQLNNRVDSLRQTMESGAFYTGANDDGKCPYCGKYQHWAPLLRNSGSGAGKEMSDRRAYASIGLFWLFAALLAGLFKPVGLWDLVMHSTVLIILVCAVILAGGILLTKLALKLWDRRTDSGAAEALRALEGLEHTTPHIVALDDQSTKAIGLSVR